jgi:glycosyltransferase involved in cell wall biosynthesis
MNSISFVIIAKDEEEMITKCLKSISWAKEVIVVDHGSLDKTPKIAKKSGAKVFSLKREEKPNFSTPRNEGLKQASGKWIFYIDADERVPESLKSELINFQNNTNLKEENHFAIPRENIILGKKLKHGGWYPDYVKRLYKKEALKGWTGDLHEEPKIEGEMGYFKHPLIHIKHETISQMIEKTNKWSQIEARLMHSSNHPPMNLPRFFSATAREFYLRMIKKTAFLDGATGIIMALYQVFSRFISYAKLYELQTKSPPKK